MNVKFVLAGALKAVARAADAQDAEPGAPLHARFARPAIVAAEESSPRTLPIAPDFKAIANTSGTTAISPPRLSHNIAPEDAEPDPHTATIGRCHRLHTEPARPSLTGIKPRTSTRPLARPLLIHVFKVMVNICETTYLSSCLRALSHHRHIACERIAMPPQECVDGGDRKRTRGSMREGDAPSSAEIGGNLTGMIMATRRGPVSDIVHRRRLQTAGPPRRRATSRGSSGAAHS
jgi:hypothetical protein